MSNLLEVGDIVVVENTHVRSEYKITRVTKTLAISKSENSEYEHRFYRDIDKGVAYYKILYDQNTYTVIKAVTEAQVQRLVDALEEIIDPVRFMQERLKEGECLNGMVAVRLAKDPGYLKDIAIAALTTYREQRGAVVNRMIKERNS